MAVQPKACAPVMRVFRYATDLERFQLLNCDDEAISYLSQGQFDGSTLRDTWRPFKVWWDPTSSGERGDFPGFPEPVISGRAAEALGDVLVRHGELLPLESDHGEFFLYNVTDLVDCLDEAASAGKRFPDGRFMWIHKHVFRPEAIGDHQVFRIPQLRRGPNIYTIDDFTDRVQTAGLRGLSPIEVWTATDGPRWFRPV